MEAVALEALQRVKRGKGYLNTLRSQGWVPGILYGNESGEVLVQLPVKELEKVLHSQTGRNSIIELKVKGDKGDRRYTVMLRDLQRNPIGGNVTHADLYQISLRNRIQAEVPLVPVGESPGVAKGGILQFTQRSLTIECFPMDIPQHIDMDMGSLDIGDKIVVADVIVPKGIGVLSDPDTVVLSIGAPRVEQEATEVATPAAPAEETREKVVAASGEGKAGKGE